MRVSLILTKACIYPSLFNRGYYFADQSMEQLQRHKKELTESKHQSLLANEERYRNHTSIGQYSDHRSGRSPTYRDSWSRERSRTQTSGSDCRDDRNQSTSSRGRSPTYGDSRSRERSQSHELSRTRTSGSDRRDDRNQSTSSRGRSPTYGDSRSRNRNREVSEARTGNSNNHWKVPANDLDRNDMRYGRSRVVSRDRYGSY